MNSGNPYRPAGVLSEMMGGVVRTIRVGANHVSSVTIQSSFWTGLTTISKDDAGFNGPVHRGPCEFELGSRERHQVSIQVDKSARVNIYVDGALKEKDLFADYRHAILVRSAAVFTILLLIGIGGMLLGYFGYEKQIEEWFNSVF